MDDARLLAELAPVGARFLDRHLDAAREWFPHDFVAPSGDPDGDLPTPDPLPAGVASALVLNSLTEDNLPFYFAGILRRLGDGQPWWDWVRRWTAEEMRHGMALHHYVASTRCIDPVALERARLASVSTGEIPGAPGVPDAFVYLALQERATRISHRNTGERLADDLGRHMLARIAADENLHHLFYRDLVAAALELDPARVVLAIDDQVRHFKMPGSTIAGFAAHALAIAAEGIYSADVLLDQVLVPVVVDQWRLDRIELPSGQAAAARDRTMQFLERFRRVAPRLSTVTT